MESVVKARPSSEGTVISFNKAAIRDLRLGKSLTLDLTGPNGSQKFILVKDKTIEQNVKKALKVKKEKEKKKRRQRK